ncbi:recombinase RecT [Mucilaginibacter gossypii]|uniref:recombinase RecT n=1 Tax=Mucilaginibacter gossypii TaxID=551996 RepID=UPI000DCC3C18|nr:MULTISPECIES: recombinase RecT [Mucilaginibacter]QTE37518.1 recombinase RecT [Mucilaginibacter gossypii]RAV52344.1 serine/threonine protein kinase [Mucilaginibacter rubeus]
MSTNNVTNVVALLNQAKPAEIAELDFVKDRFIAIHNQISGTDRGEMIYHKEVFNYKKMLSEKKELRECSPLSLYGCFLDINVNGHSLEQGTKPDCYITTRNFKVGKNDNGTDIWEKRAILQVSPYGELKLRMRAGQIKYADDPVVVYEGDHFKVGTNEKGKLVVKEYDKNFNNDTKAKIIACFVRIERPDGSYEMPYLDTTAIERLKGYSARNNGGSANALYTSNNGQIDTGFLMAKTLKHALTAYPKVQTGHFSNLEPLAEMPNGEQSPVDYGFNPNDHSGNGIQDTTYTEVTNQAANDFDAALSEQNQHATETTTIKINTSDEPDF